MTPRTIRQLSDALMTATCGCLAFELGGWRFVVVLFVYGAWSFWDGMTRGEVYDE